ncbi:chain-length determining protein [Pseudomonas sp. nanlin1]|uniref:chain-length determining protein n=1 Tax=Pseudomonas sp. nanlin1 TaxID=3040605 RepID=UPI00388F0BA9
MTANSRPSGQALPFIHPTSTDLGGVFEIIWGQKGFVSLVAIGVAFCFLAYAFIATPLFQTKLVLRPPPLHDLDELNRSGLYSLSPDEALARVALALDSYAHRAEFFENNRELFGKPQVEDEQWEQLFQAFESRDLYLRRPSSKAISDTPTQVVATLNYHGGQRGVDVLNRFVEFTVEQERASIKSDLDVIIANRIAELERRVSGARVVYESGKALTVAMLTEEDEMKRKQLLDELEALRSELKATRAARVQQLDEAITIARSLKLVHPATRSTLATRAAELASGSIRTDISNETLPLYFLGSDALEAERAVLLKRRSDDFTSPRIQAIHKELQMLLNNRKVEALNARKGEDIFLAGIDDMRAEINRLQGLKMDSAQLRLIQVDRPATEPSAPLRPRKLMLLSFGLLLGVLVGAVAALLRNMLRFNARSTPLLVHEGAPLTTAATLVEKRA